MVSHSFKSTRKQQNQGQNPGHVDSGTHILTSPKAKPSPLRWWCEVALGHPAKSSWKKWHLGTSYTSSLSLVFLPRFCQLFRCVCVCVCEIYIGLDMELQQGSALEQCQPIEIDLCDTSHRCKPQISFQNLQLLRQKRKKKQEINFNKLLYLILTATKIKKFLRVIEFVIRTKSTFFFSFFLLLFFF